MSLLIKKYVFFGELFKIGIFHLLKDPREKKKTHPKIESK